MIENKTIKALVKYFESKETMTDEECELYHECKTWQDYFPITSVHRDDLEQCGYDVDNISDSQMTRLASKMADDYCEQMFNESMDILAESLNFPKL